MADDVNMGLVDFLSRQRMSVSDMRKMATMLTLAADIKERDDNTVRSPPRSLLQPVTVATSPDLSTPEGRAKALANSDYYRNVLKPFA